MEKITIKNIEKKGKLFLVTYENGSASIAPWLEQERDFIEKDVGIGGSCNVTIEQKGDWTNITAIDMKSAVKGDCSAIASAPVGLMSVKDIMIVAQVLTKCMYAVKAPKEPQEVLDAYHFFVKELENNG